MQLKAKYSEPCKRCGLCCALSLCPAAEKAFPDDLAPCPALFWDAEEDGSASCGLVLAEKMFNGGDTVAKSLGIGCGCSCPDHDTTDEEIAAHDRRSCEKMFGTKETT